MRPLARLGYHDYTTVESIFTMAPTGANVDIREKGLEGRPRRSLR
jgi:hypothetical protein